MQDSNAVALQLLELQRGLNGAVRSVPTSSGSDRDGEHTLRSEPTLAHFTRPGEDTNDRAHVSARLSGLARPSPIVIPAQQVVIPAVGLSPFNNLTPLDEPAPVHLPHKIVMTSSPTGELPLISPFGTLTAPGTATATAARAAVVSNPLLGDTPLTGGVLPSSARASTKRMVTTATGAQGGQADGAGDPAGRTEDGGVKAAGSGESNTSTRIKEWTAYGERVIELDDGDVQEQAEFLSDSMLYGMEAATASMQRRRLAARVAGTTYSPAGMAGTTNGMGWGGAAGAHAELVVTEDAPVPMGQFQVHCYAPNCATPVMVSGYNNGVEACLATEQVNMLIECNPMLLSSAYALPSYMGSHGQYVGRYEYGLPVMSPYQDMQGPGSATKSGSARRRAAQRLDEFGMGAGTMMMGGGGMGMAMGMGAAMQHGGAIMMSGMGMAGGYAASSMGAGNMGVMVGQSRFYGVEYDTTRCGWAAYVEEGTRRRQSWLPRVFPTEEEAARARDRELLRRNKHTREPLNFPEEGHGLATDGGYEEGEDWNQDWLVDSAGNRRNSMAGSQQYLASGSMMVASRGNSGSLKRGMSDSLDFGQASSKRPRASGAGWKDAGGKGLSGVPTSKYRGVVWDEQRETWRAQLLDSGSKKVLGYFESQEEAARAYDMAVVREQRKEKTNFPPTMYKDGHNLTLTKSVRGSPSMKVTSQYKGVSWNSACSKWVAVLWDRELKRARHIGSFESEEAAARAYDREAIKMLGAEAGLNFRESLDDYVKTTGVELRVVETSQNTGGKGSSQYRGVSWHERSQRWEVRVWGGGKQHFIGSFTDEIDAARAYDKAVLRLRGQDARSRSRMNFPLSDYNLDEVLNEPFPPLVRECMVGGPGRTSSGMLHLDGLGSGGGAGDGGSMPPEDSRPARRSGRPGRRRRGDDDGGSSEDYTPTDEEMDGDNASQDVTGGAWGSGGPSSKRGTPRRSVARRHFAGGEDSEDGGGAEEGARPAPAAGPNVAALQSNPDVLTLISVLQSAAAGEANLPEGSAAPSRRVTESESGVADDGAAGAGETGSRRGRRKAALGVATLTASVAAAEGVERSPPVRLSGGGSELGHRVSGGGHRVSLTGLTAPAPVPQGTRGKSQYRGVSWCEKVKKWRALLWDGTKQRFLGHYVTDLDAARAYDRALMDLKGPDAKTNFPAHTYDNDFDDGGSQRRVTSSQYKGVSFNKSSSRWEARLRYNGRTYVIGSYGTETDAARAHDCASLHLRGPAANFPAEKYPEDEMHDAARRIENAVAGGGEMSEMGNDMSWEHEEGTVGGSRRSHGGRRSRLTSDAGTGAAMGGAAALAEAAAAAGGAGMVAGGLTAMQVGVCLAEGDAAATVHPVVHQAQVDRMQALYLGQDKLPWTSGGPVSKVDGAGVQGKMILAIASSQVVPEGEVTDSQQPRDQFGCDHPTITTDLETDGQDTMPPMEGLPAAARVADTHQTSAAATATTAGQGEGVPSQRGTAAAAVVVVVDESQLASPSEPSGTIGSDLYKMHSPLGVRGGGTTGASRAGTLSPYPQDENTQGCTQDSQRMSMMTGSMSPSQPPTTPTDFTPQPPQPPESGLHMVYNREERQQSVVVTYEQTHSGAAGAGVGAGAGMEAGPGFGGGMQAPPVTTGMALDLAMARATGGSTANNHNNNHLHTQTTTTTSTHARRSSSHSHPHHTRHQQQQQQQQAAESPAAAGAGAAGGVNGPPSLGRGRSQYRGVSWHVVNNKYIARIRTNTGGNTHLGCFDSAQEAAQAYDVAAIALRGPGSAITNFPTAQYLAADGTLRVDLLELLSKASTPIVPVPTAVAAPVRKRTPTARASASGAAAAVAAASASHHHTATSSAAATAAGSGPLSHLSASDMFQMLQQKLEAFLPTSVVAAANAAAVAAGSCALGAADPLQAYGGQQPMRVLAGAELAAAEAELVAAAGGPIPAEAEAAGYLPHQLQPQPQPQGQLGGLCSTDMVMAAVLLDMACDDLPTDGAGQPNN